MNFNSLPLARASRIALLGFIAFGLTLGGVAVTPVIADDRPKTKTKPKPKPKPDADDPEEAQRPPKPKTPKKPPKPGEAEENGERRPPKPKKPRKPGEVAEDEANTKRPPKKKSSNDPDDSAGGGRAATATTATSPNTQAPPKSKLQKVKDGLETAAQNINTFVNPPTPAKPPKPRREIDVDVSQANDSARGLNRSKSSPDLGQEEDLTKRDPNWSRPVNTKIVRKKRTVTTTGPIAEIELSHSYTLRDNKGRIVTGDDGQPVIRHVKLKPQRVLVGDNGKIAIIGVNMGGVTIKNQQGMPSGAELGVKDYAAHLDHVLNRRIPNPANEPDPAKRAQLTQARKEQAALRKALGASANQKIPINTFTGQRKLPQSARDELSNTGKQGFAGRQGMVPHEAVTLMDGYDRDAGWSQDLVNRGYTVVDLGDPHNRGFGTFYNVEVNVIFGDLLGKPQGQPDPDAKYAPKKTQAQLDAEEANPRPAANAALQRSASTPNFRLPPKKSSDPSE